MDTMFEYLTKFFPRKTMYHWGGHWARSPHTDGGWEFLHADVTDAGATVLYRRARDKNAR